MRYYVCFLKKELFEAYKTYKLFVLGAVFLVFGIMSPLLAKMTPEIVRLALQSDPTVNAEMASAFDTLFSTPKAADAWNQFYQNIGQMGLIALVIVFSGMISSELSKGTIVIILTKGMPRTAVILSKLTNAVLIWTGCLAVSFFTNWGYTAYLFPNESVPNLFFSVFCLWAFGIFLLALLILSASLTSRNYAGMLIVGITALIALPLLNIIPRVSDYNPITLCAPSGLLSGGTPDKFIPALITAGICSAAFVTGAAAVFNKRKL